MRSFSKNQDTQIFLPLFVLASILVTLFYFANDETRIHIFVEPLSQDAEFKIYWRGKTQPFHEDRSTYEYLSAGKTALVLGFRPADGPAQIRLDLSSSLHKVSLLTAVYYNGECIWPFPAWCGLDLVETRPTLFNDVEISQVGQLRLRSLGVDPYVVWSVPKDPRGKVLRLALNLILVSFCFIVMGFVLLKLMGTTKMTATAWLINSAPALLCYPIYLFIDDITSRFYGSALFGRESFYFGLLLFFLMILSQKILRLRVICSPIRSAALLILVSSVALDVMFHLAVIEDWRLGSEPKEYHWRLDRSFKDNYNKSSLKYHADLSRLKKEIPQGSRILSDTATSLYIAATTDVFIVNPLAHHRVEGGSLNGQDLQNLCERNPMWDPIAKILDRTNIDYLVVNEDKENHNIRRSCRNLRSKRLPSKFPSHFLQVFVGDNITVYKIEL